MNLRFEDLKSNSVRGTFVWGLLWLLAFTTMSSGLFKANAAAYDWNREWLVGPQMKWTGGVVPYAFDPTNDFSHRPPTRDEQEIYERAIRGWQKAGNINFVKRTTENDYIYVTASKSLSFAWQKIEPNFAWIGKSGGAQPFFIYNWDNRIILHEMGHALSLTHEHQRSDRDTHVDCWWWNAQPTTQINFTVTGGSDNRTTYDMYSVMHYDKKAFTDYSANAPLTLRPKDEKYLDIIGANNWFGEAGTIPANGVPPTSDSLTNDEFWAVGTYGYLSPKDRQGIASEYGAPGRIIGTVTKNGATMSAVEVRLLGTGNVVDTVSRMKLTNETPDTSDMFGGFEFKGLPNGSYIVKPVLAGYRFSPATQSVTVSSGNTSTVAFTATVDDSAPPDVTITTIDANTPAFKARPVITGTATDGSGSSGLSSGVNHVGFALSNSDAQYYNKNTGAFDSTTFNSANHRWTQTSGAENWSFNPGLSLSDGWYQFHVNAVDNNGNDSGYTTRAFYIDNTSPSVAFAPFVDEQRILDFGLVGGTVSDNMTSVTTRFSIRQDGTNKYWYSTPTTSGWVEGLTMLSGRVDGNIWRSNVTLPTRANIPQSGFTIAVAVADKAGNAASTSIHVTRIPTDTTVPDLAIASPTANKVFTTNNLGTLSGIAQDLQTGLSEVTIYLLRVKAGGGFQSWNGTTWTDAQTPLPVTLDAETGIWTAPATSTAFTYALPSGTNLVNGAYQLQAYAKNQETGLTTPGTRGVSVNFTVACPPPLVGITSPANGATVSTLSSISGTASDNNGIDRVVLFLRRNSDNKYWNGTTWITEALSANLPTSFNATNGTWTNSGSLPSVGAGSLTGGSYTVTAIAFNTANAQTQADSTIEYHTTYTWTGATMRDSDPNNNSDHWGTPGNWSPVGTPGPGDVVYIGNGDTVRSTISRTVYGFNLSSGALDFDNATDGLIITKTGSWTGGSLEERLNIESGATFTISGVNTKYLGHSFVVNNSGAVTWSGGPIRGYQNSTWNNKSGSTFTMASDGDVFANYYGGNVFNNEAGATLRKTVGAGGTATSYIDEWTVNNNGAIASNQGVLQFYTTLNLNSGSTLAGSGKVLLTATTNLSAPLSSTCSLPELAGDLNASGTAAYSGTSPLVWSGGTISGPLTLNAGSVLNLATTNMKQLGGGAVFTNKGTVNWLDGGVLRGYQNSTFNNESGAFFFMATDGDVFGHYYGGNVFNNKAGAAFVKSGKTAAVDGSSFIDEWTFNNAGTIRNNTGLLKFNLALNLNGGGTITRNGSAAARVVSTHSVLTGTTTVSNVVFEQAGDWHGNTTEGTAGNGTIATNTGGVFEWTGGTAHNTVNIAPASTFLISGASLKQLGGSGVLNNRGNATWTGTGELRGYQNSTFNNLAGATFTAATDADFTNYYGGNTIVNAGTVNIGNPLGISDMGWNFTQSSVGRTNIQIGGVNAATPQFDQLNVGGGLSLGGTLGVSFINGYVPPAGTAFKIINGARTGSFGTTNPAFETIYNASDVTLIFDRTLPNVAITSPANGSVVQTLPSVSGTASDAGSGLARVVLVIQRKSDNLYWTGTTWGAATALATTISGNIWNRNVALPSDATLPDGNYLIQAFAYDNAKNFRRVDSLITKRPADTTLPTVTIASPANNSFVKALPAISGTTSDNIGVTRVDLYLKRNSDGKFWNGSIWTTITALATTLSNTAPRTWTRNTAMPAGANLTAGSYLITARAFDAAGNGTSALSTFTVDLAPPTISIASPANGSTVSSFASINGTTNDTGGSGLARVVYYLKRNADSKKWNAATATWGDAVTENPATLGTPPSVGAPTPWSASANLPKTTNLVDGAYTLTVVSYDRATNSGSAASTFTLKRTAAVAPTPEPTPTATPAPAPAATSPIQLSSTIAKSDGTIRLAFTGALHANSTDGSRYVVTQNGAAVEVQSVQQPGASEVVLTLDALTIGARVAVTYTLQDTQGRTLTGTANATVR